jgi:hypothetical protein
MYCNKSFYPSQVMINSLSPKLYKKLYSAKSWLLNDAWEPNVIVASTDDERRKKAISFAFPESDAAASIAESSSLFSASDSQSAVDMAEAARRAVDNVERGFIDRPDSSGGECSKRPSSSSSTIYSRLGRASAASNIDPEIPPPTKRTSTKGASFAQVKASDFDFSHLTLEERVKIMKVSTGQLRDWYTGTEELAVTSPDHKRNRVNSMVSVRKSEAPSSRGSFQR